ncbi:Fasciclin-like arabinogalactan protein 11 [Morella rubra]|uniref:Fasciclin-like arabinogalactan protein 11 n=1 Tax=Morella rubra TaxID=262757 RepID=A0A6A1WMQ5_9ROSI|nr:Fasciclin-like arabinogalactan protein 11 [Morella rubra]
MIKQSLFALSFLLLFVFHCSTTLAQPAPAPAPPGPTNVTKILEKAGQYTILIRLLKSTKVGDQLNQQLNDSNNGITFFAPTDNAFSNLKAGTLNGLTDEQKVELIQFHILPTFLSISNFQTVSNPVRTQAGDSRPGEFPLNVTTSGNQVNVTSGLVNTTVGGTVYSDNQLAVYQVDSVLLPQDIFAPKPPAPAPAPSQPKAKTKKKTADSPSGDATVDASGAVSLTRHGILMSIGVAVIAGLSL